VAWPARYPTWRRASGSHRGRPESALRTPTRCRGVLVPEPLANQRSRGADMAAIGRCTSLGKATSPPYHWCRARPARSTWPSVDATRARSCGDETGNGSIATPHIAGFVRSASDLLATRSTVRPPSVQDDLAALGLLRPERRHKDTYTCPCGPWGTVSFRSEEADRHLQLRHFQLECGELAKTEVGGRGPSRLSSKASAPLPK
jgi:hypothetical protein